MLTWKPSTTASFVIAVVVIAGSMATPAQAQITRPRILSASPDRFASLQEQLTNRLRATTEEKKAYIRRLIKLVREKKLEVKLVIAIERQALQRRPAFPFPYFEQAMKIAAARQKVLVPTVREYELARAAADRFR